jgi:hypothetical protein
VLVTALFSFGVCVCACICAEGIPPHTSSVWRLWSVWDRHRLDVLSSANDSAVFFQNACVCVCARASLRNNFSHEFGAYSSHQRGIPDCHIEAKGHVTGTSLSTVSTFNTSKLSVLKRNPCCWNSEDYPCVTIPYHILMEFQFLHKVPPLSLSKSP